jgi:hypothetical protein
MTTTKKQIKVGFVKAQYKWLTGPAPQLDHADTHYQVRTIYKAFAGENEQHIMDSVRSWCVSVGMANCVSITREEFEEHANG